MMMMMMMMIKGEILCHIFPCEVSLRTLQALCCRGEGETAV